MSFHLIQEESKKPKLEVLAELPVASDTYEQYYSKQKCKITGDIIHISEFGKAYAIGQRQYKYSAKEKTDNEEHEPEKLSSEEIRAKSLRRAKTKLIDLINSNAFAWVDDSGREYHPVFLTLTMDENKIGIAKATDIDTANYEFKKFIQRLSHFITKDKRSYLKYVAVIEFQKDTDYHGRPKPNGGAIHYHLILFNMPYVHKTEIEKIWSNGFIKIKEIKEVKDVGFYVSKYMVKDIHDPRLKGHKCYFASDMLLPPVIIHIEELINLIKHLLPKESLEVENLGSPIKYLSSMDYRRYNLKLYQEVKKEIHTLIKTFR